MKRNWLKSTTALAVVIGMAVPHGAIAQSAENSTSGITLEGQAQGNANAENLGGALGLNQNEKKEDEEAQQAQQNQQAEEQAQQNNSAEQNQQAQEQAQQNQAEQNQQAEAQAEQNNSAEQGQAEQAEALEQELENAADAEEATEQAQDNAGQAAEQAADVAEQAQENVQDTAEQAQETAEDQSGEGNSAVDELKNALGGNSDSDADADANANANANANGNADANADANANATADTGNNADADAENQSAEGNSVVDELKNALGANSDSDADANANANANAEANANANAEVDEEVVEEAMEKAERDDVEQLSPEQQAQQATQSAADTGAAALSGVGELLDRTQETVTEEQARSSNEEFDTDVNGQARANARAAAQADDDDDDLAQVLGAAAVGVLGAYMVGQSFEGGGQVVSNTGDRVVVEQDGQYRVLRDDNALLRRPGSNVETETYSDGSTRTIIDHDDGSRVVTVRSSNGAILQRVLVRPDGQEIVLIDDTRDYSEVDVTRLQQQQADSLDYNPGETDELRTALAANSGNMDRAYSLNQVRNINVVRNQVPVISLDSVNFETNSAVIRPEEAEELQALGDAMREAIEENPQQLFLVEGHTDTVGRAAYNLALSDRRAESVALALTEYFNVPPANMIVQGYGESDLKVQQTGDVRQNRRAAVRNITPLLNGG
ncbi:MAG: OmpA family protein [Roseovarius sp.]